MNDRLLDQADTLMRRRSFIAGAKAAMTAESDAPDLPLPTAVEARANASLDDLDIPVLTEIIDTAADAPATEQTSGDTQLEARLLAQQEEFRQTLETWLDEALPKAVAGALDGIGDYLVNELRDRARAELLPTTKQPVTDAESVSDEIVEELRNDPL